MAIERCGEIGGLPVSVLGIGQTRGRRFVVGCVQIDADIVPSEIAGGDESRAAAAEGIEDRVARFREGLDDRVENRDRFRFNSVPSFDLIERENATGSFITVQGARPFTTVGAISGVTNVGSSMYHSLQLRAVRQFSRSFSFFGTYTFSKSTDDGSGLWASSQPNGLDQGQYPNISRRLDHSLSSFDRTHSATVSLRYTTRGPKWLRGFSLDPLLTARTGVPLTISQTNLDPDVIQQRPNAIAPITQIYTTPKPEGTGIRYLLSPTDPAFPLAPTGPLFATVNGSNRMVLPASIGTLGRYVIRAPGDVNLNLALSRRFQLRERLAFTMRVDSYNALNHTNFASPSTSLAVTANSSGQGVFTSPGFGLVTSARGARTTQLIARFDF